MVSEPLNYLYETETPVACSDWTRATEGISSECGGEIDVYKVEVCREVSQEVRNTHAHCACSASWLVMSHIATTHVDDLSNLIGPKCHPSLVLLLHFTPNRVSDVWRALLSSNLLFGIGECQNNALNVVTYC
jgi:hypothetical protein